MYNLPVMERRPNITRFTSRFAAIFLFLAAFCLPGEARDGDNKAVLITDQCADDSARLFLTCPNTLEASVHFDCPTLNNAEATHSLPYDFSIDGAYRQREFLRVKQRQPGEWRYHYKYKFKVGIASNRPTVDYVYSLPYSALQHYTVSQSYLGKFSHFTGSQTEYAVDFRMPEGTKVLAARPGTVIAFRDDSTVGGPTKDFLELENYVIVKHDDGTYTNYLHLKPQGVLVRLGQSVTVGTPIALSGCTGWSTEPHLHFGVYRVKDWSEIVSVPFRMKTSVGILKQLQQGETY